MLLRSAFYARPENWTGILFCLHFAKRAIDPAPPFGSSILREGLTRVSYLKVPIIMPTDIRTNSCGASGSKSSARPWPWEKMPTLLRWSQPWQRPLTGSCDLQFASERNSFWSLRFIPTSFNCCWLIAKERRHFFKKREMGERSFQGLASQQEN